MSMIYIAGPYSADTVDEVNKNVRRAEEAGQMVLGMGLLPVIPHKISSHWDTWGLLTHWTHDDWINRFCKPLLARCDGALFIDGWRESKGARIEHDYARDCRIPRFFSLRELEEMHTFLNTP